jgi:hypothetical protein
MASQNIDPALRERFEELVRDELVPTHSSERLMGAQGDAIVEPRYTHPYPVYRVELADVASSAFWSAAQQVGWQSLVFDGELPVSTPEVPNDSLDLASSGNEESARALAHALDVAHELVGTDEAEFVVLRVPQFLSALVLPNHNAAIALEVPRPPDMVQPFRAYSIEELGAIVRDAARDVLDLAAETQQQQVVWLPPNTRRKG